MSLIKTFCFFALATLWMVSCKDEPKIPFNVSGVKCKLAPDQSETMGKFINDYLSLKDALVATNSENANNSAIAMQRQMKAFTITHDSMQENLSSEWISMEKDLSDIIIHNEKGCEPQRIYFKSLSDSLYAFVKNYGVTNLHLYRHFCPMALNGNGGAWWLSTSRKVENPYFGSKMLTCGELVDTLQ